MPPVDIEPPVAAPPVNAFVPPRDKLPPVMSEVPAPVPNDRLPPAAATGTYERPPVVELPPVMLAPEPPVPAVVPASIDPAQLIKSAKKARYPRIIILISQTAMWR